MILEEQTVHAEEFISLWKAVMPDLESPDLQQFILWTELYSDTLVSRGIARAGAKTRTMSRAGTPMTAYDATRYAASVMKNELLGVRRHGTQPR